MAFYDKTGKKREANVLASNAEALVLPPSVATQWQLGDWPSLRALSLEWLEQQEGRANLASVVAIAHYQSGDYKSAQNLIDSAITRSEERRVGRGEQQRRDEETRRTGEGHQAGAQGGQEQ